MTGTEKSDRLYSSRINIFIIRDKLRRSSVCVRNSLSMVRKLLGDTDRSIPEDTISYRLGDGQVFFEGLTGYNRREKSQKRL